jgi:two-component system KDP operon response regulator KdpE
MVGGRTRILAVDDEPQILRLVRNALSEAGYAPIVTGNPDEVERLVEVEKPDLVLLDMALPDTDGIELMKRILDIVDVPVIFLSGHDREDVVVRAFSAGADDYIVKPFSSTEMIARIEAVLRRQAASNRTRGREPYRLDGLAIDYAERRVTVAGRPVRLTATEYKLLFELSVHAGRVLTHDQLLARVWGAEYSGDSRLVRAFVKKLRRKLRDDAGQPTYIFTEPRVGYRMAKPGASKDIAG